MPETIGETQYQTSNSSRGDGKVSISIVSHGQADLVVKLLADLQAFCLPDRIQVILTLNLDENLPFRPTDFAYDCVVVRNVRPKGFGANHNASIRHAACEFFCVLNPDMRFTSDPFSLLVDKLRDERVGAVSARVVGPGGGVEDHAREFPRLRGLLRKALAGGSGASAGMQGTSKPDWIAGMFMLFRTALFRQIGGFDTRYFLYYEDVDLCARLRKAGYEILVDPAARVIHHARRESHRNPKYFLWHLQSVLRFLMTRLRTLPPLQ